ncbi:MAG TPA: RNA polymerase sigma-70 factor [Pyrinomonadaceae bacterium]|nr:RNA polymerase sigma-70 factor [Pyrinomonadaceae bacterium]
MISDEKRVEVFRQYRVRLFGIAYRMLGTNSDAEDILQEAYIRWHQANVDEIETPEAWLVTVVTRLSIDRLRKASNERETYIGPWLPEPLTVSNKPSPEEEMEFASNLSLAFMFLLERLSPVERAVFLLHDIFECDYAEIARIIGKSESASRQIIHRARERVRTDKPRFETTEKERTNLIRKFSAASYAGNEQTLLSLFSDEISMVSDGGGKVSAARKIVHGKSKLARLFSLNGIKHGESFKNVLQKINGELGLLTFYEGKVFAATTFEFTEGKISAMYRVMNPDKLKAFAELNEN